MTGSISLRNDRAEFARLRAMVEGFSEKERLHETMGYRLVLILEELFTNVYKYSTTKPQAGAINVVLKRAGEIILIDFADDGPPFNPLTLPKPRIDRQLDDRPVGGLGIHIVRSMTRTASYERDDGWNRLKLTCAIKP